MKAWVASAFDDPFASCSNNTTTGKKTYKTKSLKAYKSDEPKSSSTLIKKNSSIIDVDLLLSEKHEPKTRGELMVNKSKVDELSNFLDGCFRKVTQSIFILNGPPGNPIFSHLLF